MAGMMESPSAGRRSLDASLNLVPFIDLLSMCICFLLMTVVWIEIGSIQVHQLFGTESMLAKDSKKLEFDVRVQNPQNVIVQVMREGAVVRSFEAQGVTFAALQKDLDRQLEAILGPLGGAGMEGVELSGRVHTHKLVPYGDVVSILDLLNSYGVRSLAMLPGESL